jgi:hypothetical protein
VHQVEQEPEDGENGRRPGSGVGPQVNLRHAEIIGARNFVVGRRGNPRERPYKPFGRGLTPAKRSPRPHKLSLPLTPAPAAPYDAAQPMSEWE